MRALVFAAVITVTLLQAGPANRFAETADLAMAERDYREMLREDPADPTLNYNLGTILLLADRHDEARAYLDAARNPGSPLVGDANYNLGNTDLLPAFADTALAERDQRLRRSIDAYKRALLANPDDEDARWNLELARRLLERDTPPPSGGGGGGGGGQGPPMPGDRAPSPVPSPGPGAEPDVSQAEAEELLRSARERELQVQRDRLRKPQTDGIRP